MRRTNRTLEEKQHILRELAAWKDNGGEVKDFALKKGIERRSLYSWMGQISEANQPKKQIKRSLRKQQSIQIPSSENTAEKQEYSFSVPIRIIGSEIRVELPAGCRKEDLDLVINSGKFVHISERFHGGEQHSSRRLSAGSELLRFGIGKDNCGWSAHIPHDPPCTAASAADAPRR